MPTCKHRPCNYPAACFTVVCNQTAVVITKIFMNHFFKTTIILIENIPYKLGDMPT